MSAVYCTCTRMNFIIWMYTILFSMVISMKTFIWNHHQVAKPLGHLCVSPTSHYRVFVKLPDSGFLNLSMHCKFMVSPISVKSFLVCPSERKRVLALLVYVNDVILAGNDTKACIEFKSYLHTRFSIKDLGPLKYFLGIEIARGPQGLFLANVSMR